MTIRVEFYGVARLTAGCAAIQVEARTLREALARLRDDLPAFSSACISEGALLPGYLANVNGQRFTNDPNTPLQDGDSLLILSADMGG